MDEEPGWSPWSWDPSTQNYVRRKNYRNGSIRTQYGQRQGPVSTALQPRYPSSRVTLSTENYQQDGEQGQFQPFSTASQSRYPSSRVAPPADTDQQDEEQEQLPPVSSPNHTFYPPKQEFYSAFLSSTLRNDIYSAEDSLPQLEPLRETDQLLPKVQNSSQSSGSLVDDLTSVSAGEELHSTDWQSRHNPAPDAPSYVDSTRYRQSRHDPALDTPSYTDPARYRQSRHDPAPNTPSYTDSARNRQSKYDPVPNKPSYTDSARYRHTRHNPAFDRPAYSSYAHYRNHSTHLQSPNDVPQMSQAVTRETSVENLAGSFSTLDVGNDLGFESITRPDRFFRLGRIFKTTDEDEAFVVVQENQGFSTVCAIGESPGPTQDNSDSSLQQFPIIVENSSVSINSPISLNFDRFERIDYGVKVQKIGRIDRNHLDRLRNCYDLSTSSSDISGKRADSIPASQNIGVSDLATRTSIPVLHSGFRVHSSRHFIVGKVFTTLWSEPSGANSEASDDSLFFEGASKFGERSYHSIRRFVVASAKSGHCLCLAIFTYGGKGTAKWGVKPQDHAIIYMPQVQNKSSGLSSVRELEGENKLHKSPIRVVPATDQDKLSPASRLNYAKVYSIEYNLKVHFIGKIHKDSQSDFLAEFRSTFMD